MVARPTEFTSFRIRSNRRPFCGGGSRNFRNRTRYSDNTHRGRFDREGARNFPCGNESPPLVCSMNSSEKIAGSVNHDVTQMNISNWSIDCTGLEEQRSNDAITLAPEAPPVIFGDDYLPLDYDGGFQTPVPLASSKYYNCNFIRLVKKPRSPRQNFNFFTGEDLRRIFDTIAPRVVSAGEIEDSESVVDSTQVQMESNDLNVEECIGPEPLCISHTNFSNAQENTFEENIVAKLDRIERVIETHLSATQKHQFETSQYLGRISSDLSKLVSILSAAPGVLVPVINRNETETEKKKKRKQEKLSSQSGTNVLSVSDDTATVHDEGNMMGTGNSYDHENLGRSSIHGGKSTGNCMQSMTEENGEPSGSSNRNKSGKKRRASDKDANPVLLDARPEIDTTDRKEIKCIADMGERLEIFTVDAQEFVCVYVDGFCCSDGRGGIGIWFGEEHPLNISSLLDGTQTNFNPKVQAARLAIEWAAKVGIKRVRVFSGSSLLKHATQIPNWKMNGWGNIKEIPNKSREELKKLSRAMVDIDVKFDTTKNASFSGQQYKKQTVTLNPGASEYLVTAGPRVRDAEDTIFELIQRLITELI